MKIRPPAGGPEGGSAGEYMYISIMKGVERNVNSQAG